MFRVLSRKVSANLKKRMMKPVLIFFEWNIFWQNLESCNCCTSLTHQILHHSIFSCFLDWKFISKVRFEYVKDIKTLFRVSALQTHDNPGFDTVPPAPGIWWASSRYSFHMITWLVTYRLRQWPCLAIVFKTNVEKSSLLKNVLSSSDHFTFSL